MANESHLEMLSRGVTAWNQWRDEHPEIIPDLSEPPPSQLEADIGKLVDAVGSIIMRDRAPPNDRLASGMNLVGVNLREALLSRADFSRAILMLAKLERADLSDTSLAGAILTSANLTGANLRGANLAGAILRGAQLMDATLSDAILTMADLADVKASGADFSGADLTSSVLVGADLSGANLTGSHVYGVSAWNVNLDGAIQRDLSITRASEPTITLDDLLVAQFLYLILDNRAIRSVLDTVTTKIVLLLGRFSAERKAVLNALREFLRDRGYVPVIFDFERPTSRDFTETVVTLAHMARFIVADLTDPASLPKELEAIVPRLAVPVQPVIEAPNEPYAMFSDYWKYEWVLAVHRYTSQEELIASFNKELIERAERKADELGSKRTHALSREDG
jgi:hypothetical protein